MKFAYAYKCINHIDIWLIIAMSSKLFSGSQSRKITRTNVIRPVIARTSQTEGEKKVPLLIIKKKRLSFLAFANYKTSLNAFFKISVTCMYTGNCFLILQNTHLVNENRLLILAVRADWYK